MGLSGEQKYCQCGGVIAGINLATSGQSTTSYCATGGDVPPGFTQIAADGNGNAITTAPAKTTATATGTVSIASYTGTTPEGQDEEDNLKHCIIYMPPSDEPNVSSNQCQEFCKDAQPDENGLKSIICSDFWPAGSPDPWVDNPDKSGGKLMRGDCSCNNKFLNFVVHEVLEALPAIAEIGCNLLMAAFQFIVQLALQATGIGRVVDAAMAMGAQAAKTVAYAYDIDSEALENFINWASFCGTDHLPGDMAKVFSVLRDVEDALVGFKVPKGLTTAGGGKGKGGYGKCKNSKHKRGGDGKCDKDDKGDKDATTITKSEADLKTITMTCEGKKYPQACAHYLSAVEVHKAATRFTCSDSNSRTDAKATSTWTSQHTNKKWQEYTTIDGLKCDADEWPPGYFWDQGKTLGQIVRWIPDGDNRGVAASNWGGFCGKNDGGEGNGQYDKDGLVNKDLVNLGKSKVDKKNGKTEVIQETTSYEAKFTRAVFEFDFDKDVAGKDKDYAISDNDCWPRWILPNDPGYCLLKDDDWYGENNGADEFVNQYEDEPDPKLIAAADKRKKDAGGGSKLRRQLQMNDGGLAVREANLTRRLTEDEIARDVEIIPCTDRTCVRERREYQNEEGLLFIDGEQILAPRDNPAEVSAIPRAATTLEVRVRRREEILPELPAITGLAALSKRAEDDLELPPFTKGPI
ncbi:uncharacterized protein KY384_007296 [Bacidia gigantensis]|uniref:uncharacterized protein n=1 Tax=Bacidia gigantensis TaxID=2732470 RepID=UPI001D03FD2C|nr:uncharacterized protein KY384_007296 [Bacidia gigantensis]KAG8528378.1 hypothetical protein KY384_007296 [Bacidia gigantensis]